MTDSLLGQPPDSRNGRVARLPVSRNSAAARDWRPAIISALVALACYAVTLGGTYVYDDRYIVLADPRIADISAWKDFWSKDYFNGGADNLYRPLVSMTYAVQAKLHGTGDDRAWAFHLVNLLLHAAATAAVAEIARRITRSSPVALIAGVLFAVHPIHVEAVANIVGRAELICGLAMFTAIALFLRPMSVLRAVAICGCFIVALLSKEQAMLLPLLLVAAIPLRDRGAVLSSSSASSSPEPSQPASPSATILPGAPARKPRRRFSTATLTLILLTCWTLAVYIFLRENVLHLKFWWDRSFLDETINPMILSTGKDRWLLPFALFGRYVALLITPLHLLPDYGGDVIGSRVHFNDPYFYLGLVCTAASIVACVFAALRRNWAVLFCLLGFALLTGMVINFVTLIGTNFGERLMYMPSAFLCILAGMGLAKLSCRPAMAIATLIIVLYATRTISYAAEWNNPSVLFVRGIERQPKSIHLYMLLSEEMQRHHEWAAARQVLALGRNVAPNYYKVWLKSAALELEIGDFDSAMRFAERGQRIKPTGAGVIFMKTIQEARDRAATQPTSRISAPPATSPPTTIP